MQQTGINQKFRNYIKVNFSDTRTLIELSDGRRALLEGSMAVKVLCSNIHPDNLKDEDVISFFDKGQVVNKKEHKIVYDLSNQEMEDIRGFATNREAAQKTLYLVMKRTYQSNSLGRLVVAAITSLASALLLLFSRTIYREGYLDDGNSNQRNEKTTEEDDRRNKEFEEFTKIVEKIKSGELSLSEPNPENGDINILDKEGKVITTLKPGNRIQDALRDYMKKDGGQTLNR